MLRWKENYVENTQKKCITVTINGDFESGKPLYLEPDWTFQEFMNASSNRLNIVPVATRAFNVDGVELDDCMMIEDNDLIFLSHGDDFIVPTLPVDPNEKVGGKEGESIPALVGGYKVTKFLGRGGFGEVRVGEHQLTNEKVALKFLRKSEIMSIGAAERTATEIQCLMTLKHQNIIRLMQHIETPNHIVLVFELMEGGDLLKYLCKRGNTAQKIALSEEEARTVFHQIISAISFAHNQHICHRDLKLENILLKGPSLQHVKIADFGLSDFYRPGSTMKSNCGTISFLAPEVFRGTSNAGPPLDVWSLGVILFALLCGRLPFEGTELCSSKRPRDAIIKARILKCQYKIDEQLGPEIKDLLRRMLRLDPDERASIPEIFNHCWMRPIHNTIPIDVTNNSSNNSNSSSSSSSSVNYSNSNSNGGSGSGVSGSSSSMVSGISGGGSGSGGGTPTGPSTNNTFNSNNTPINSSSSASSASTAAISSSLSLSANTSSSLSTSSKVSWMASNHELTNNNNNNNNNTGSQSSNITNNTNNININSSSDVVDHLSHPGRSSGSRPGRHSDVSSSTSSRANSTTSDNGIAMSISGYDYSQDRVDFSFRDRSDSSVSIATTASLSGISIGSIGMHQKPLMMDSMEGSSSLDANNSSHLSNSSGTSGGGGGTSNNSNNNSNNSNNSYSSNSGISGISGGLTSPAPAFKLIPLRRLNTNNTNNGNNSGPSSPSGDVDYGYVSTISTPSNNAKSRLSSSKTPTHSLSIDNELDAFVMSSGMASSSQKASSNGELTSPLSTNTTIANSSTQSSSVRPSTVHGSTRLQSARGGRQHHQQHQQHQQHQRSNMSSISTPTEDILSSIEIQPSSPALATSKHSAVKKTLFPCSTGAMDSSNATSGTSGGTSSGVSGVGGISGGSSSDKKGSSSKIPALGLSLSSAWSSGNTGSSGNSGNSGNTTTSSSGGGGSSKTPRFSSSSSSSSSTSDKGHGSSPWTEREAATTNSLSVSGILLGKTVQLASKKNGSLR